MTTQPCQKCLHKSQILRQRFHEISQLKLQLKQAYIDKEGLSLVCAQQREEIASLKKSLENVATAFEDFEKS